MNEERPSERLGEREIERDSQLSAMFDGELPAAECELLARRLTRDEMLRSQWSRYSLIGAALRAERGVKLDDRVAKRVQAVLAQEPTYGEGGGEVTTRSAALVAAPVAHTAGAERWMRFARPAVGAGIAAGVAAVSILWLRGVDGESGTLSAANTIPVAQQPAAAAPAAMQAPATLAQAGSVPAVRGEPDYSTPAPTSRSSIAPPGRLANYVVAHSEYSGPLSRRMALLSLVGSDGQVQAASAPDDTEAVESAEAADAR